MRNKDGNEMHILLRCKETERWIDNFFNEKCLQISEEIVHIEIIIWGKITELKKTGKFFYKSECKWENN